MNLRVECPCGRAYADGEASALVVIAQGIFDDPPHHPFLSCRACRRELRIADDGRPAFLPRVLLHVERATS